MPSGSKKRKAAKKKKELQSNSENNSPRDRDDAKSQDEKGSDGSEVSSPASQGDRSNRHPFDEGDRPRASSAENAPRGGEGEQKVGFMESVAGKIERRLKSDGSSSSSSSSSDDESRAVEKKKKDKAAIQVGENKSNGSDNLVKPVVPVSEETVSFVEAAVPVVLEVVKAENCAVDSSKTAPETISLPVSDYDSKASPSKFESDSKGYEGKELPPSDVFVASPSSDTVPSKGTETPEHSGNQPQVAPVQKTSVFNCCGIFDLFSRSS